MLYSDLNECEKIPEICGIFECCQDLPPPSIYSLSEIKTKGFECSPSLQSLELLHGKHHVRTELDEAEHRHLQGLLNAIPVRPNHIHQQDGLQHRAPPPLLHGLVDRIISPMMRNAQQTHPSQQETSPNGLSPKTHHEISAVQLQCPPNFQLIPLRTSPNELESPGIAPVEPAVLAERVLSSPLPGVVFEIVQNMVAAIVEDHDAGHDHKIPEREPSPNVAKVAQSKSTIK